MFAIAYRLLPLALSLLLFTASVSSTTAQEPISLLDDPGPLHGWTFYNGSEFPGAKGSLTMDEASGRDSRKSLKLIGDFTGGGGYVQAGKVFKTPIELSELSFWLKNPQASKVTLRLGDASGQTHQIVLKTNETDDWQQIVLPIERFFTRRGQADAVTSVVKYESWGGAKDGKWHGPARALYILLGKRDKQVQTLWLSDVNLVPKPTIAPGVEVAKSVRLDEVLEGQHDWRFTKGEEFKGAQGSLSLVADEPVPGFNAFKMSGDFTGGGAYVAMNKDLQPLEAKELVAVRLKYRTTNAKVMRVQLVDGTGQTHQNKGLKLTTDGEWHSLTVDPKQVAGGEHWGGANDGKWHGEPKLISLALSTAADPDKQPVVMLADIRADALLPVFVHPAAFAGNFETDKLDPSWQTTGNVKLDSEGAYKGTHSLLVNRILDKIDDPCFVVSPAFKVSPGQWQIGLAAKSDLHSPDNSYQGVVKLECLDTSGKLVEAFTIAEITGKQAWKPASKQVVSPPQASTARFRIELAKTYGSLWIDELSASYLAPAVKKDERIARLLFGTQRLGNLLYPQDPRKVTLTVEATRPLRDNQLTVSYEVRDYWGAEQMRPATAPLAKGENKKDKLIYEATVDLADVPLEIGRYYELHASIPQDGTDPFRNYTSLAILPEAAANAYKPEEIPFLSRNWDNRITAYIELSHRLGLRTCGIWGGWSPKPPYKPEAPNLDLARKLGMGWISGTPISGIERGSTTYDETALRQGVKNLIETYGHERPMWINLGNEPHGTGDKVLRNVAAYKAVYAAIKEADPIMFVVATAVEPNEEYFAAGYGNACDAYDFHVYEHYTSVRRTMEHYKQLMTKYDCQKPIWSTELGLNSQGQTRLAVANELVKKTTTFFAAGGGTMSWFGLLYPDADGKSFGSSGDAHNVFDCRYNRYCPRLDAVMYYHMVNSIAIKKFVDEQTYDGTQATLFRDRDGRSLQILWNDKSRQEVSVPLAGVKTVDVLRIDGSKRTLSVDGGAVTLSVAEEPLLLMYDGGPEKLPASLGKPAATLSASVKAMPVGGTVELTVAAQDASGVKLVTPLNWQVRESKSAGEVRFLATSPADSALHSADFVVRLENADGKRVGELYQRVPISR